MARPTVWAIWVRTAPSRSDWQHLPRQYTRGGMLGSMMSVLLALLPPFLAIPIRRWRGARIGQAARIGWLALVDVDDLRLDDGARIGMLAAVRAQRLTMGRGAAIRPLSIVSTHTIELGESVQIAPTAIIFASRSRPTARFVAGDHSRIFPFCWIEPGEGIELGRHVGIGGHGLIFTHGSWSDYLNNGPVIHGPVKIEDNVWLPWRVTVLAGVTIGSNSIVMSGSVVTRSVPPNVMVGGAPAKVIREIGPAGLDAPAKLARAREIVDAFAVRYRDVHGEAPARTIRIDEAAELQSGDILFAVSASPTNVNQLVAGGITVIDHPGLTIYQAGTSELIDEFAEFLSGYGIRLYRR